MKAITVSQPHASLIAGGEKWVENRESWGYGYRGTLAIHAGKGEQYLDAEALREYPTGCIVAVTTLEAVLPLELLRRRPRDTRIRQGLAFGDVLDHQYTEGPVCLVLRGTVRLPAPVPCRGKQGLWEVPKHLLGQLRAAMEERC